MPAVLPFPPSPARHFVGILELVRAALFNCLADFKLLLVAFGPIRKHVFSHRFETTKDAKTSTLGGPMTEKEPNTMFWASLLASFF